LFLEPCDKKTTYDTHNTTVVVNVTSFENVSVLENVRSRRGTPTRLPDALDAPTAYQYP